MARRRPRLRRAILIVVGALVVVVLVAVGLGAWTVQRSFPQMAGHLELAGLNGAVAVTRDGAGVPVVEASTSHDLFFAQGFVQAQDRFWEMDFRRHVTAGRLSELFGASQLDTDRFIRTLGWRHVAEEEVAQLDPTALGYYQAYADGVNAYLADHRGAAASLEYAVLDLQNPGYMPEKWTPADSVAWLKAMAWDLRDNLQDEISRAELIADKYTPSQLADLYPDYPFDVNPTIVPTGAAGSDAHASDAAIAPAAVTTTTSVAAPGFASLGAAIAQLPELLGRAGNDIGSNSWVISGKYTKSGKPLLANDPHLGPALPSVWYQMGLKCRTLSAACPFDVTGFSFSGMPGIIIGHNARVAWGFTNLTADVTDLFIEKVAGDTYELDGRQRPLTVRHETIKVAGGKDVPLTIRSTEHGPLVTNVGGDYDYIAGKYPAKAGLPAGKYQVSLQWTALTPGSTATAIFAIDSSRDWATFRAAARLFEVPAQNLLYADVDGNIGYQTPGRLPIRRMGDGTVPLPGWTSSNGWSGDIPFEKLPHLFNPPSGFIVTANNAVVDDASPLFLAKDWDKGYRAAEITRRIQELIASGRKIVGTELSDIQDDNHVAIAQTLEPYLAAVAVTGDAAKGQKLLADWNFSDDVDSAQAAYFNVFWKTLLDQNFGSKLPYYVPPTGGSDWYQIVDKLITQPDSSWWARKDASGGRDAALARALGTAWRSAQELMGSDPAYWSWGRLHTLTATNQTFGQSGIAPIEWLFNRGPYPVSGGSSVVDATGWTSWSGYAVDWVPSMRIVTDLSDFDASTWINLTGASGHAFDANYVDQLPLWQHHQTRPWPFSASAVATSGANVLRLSP
jgi:penicillin amidase